MSRPGELEESNEDEDNDWERFRVKIHFLSKVSRPPRTANGEMDQSHTINCRRGEI